MYTIIYNIYVLIYILYHVTISVSATTVQDVTCVWPWEARHVIFPAQMTGPQDTLWLCQNSY